MLLGGAPTPIQLDGCPCFCLRAGIGLPAVAASGAILANTLSPIGKHLKMLDEIGV